MSSSDSKLRFSGVSPQNNVPKMEESILAQWDKDQIYEKTQASRAKNGKKFAWLEGPPTANGKPHAGHALTRTLKDGMLRYKNMQGYHVVPRIGGWDCHGLPVELEIEKEMGFNSKNDIETYGIEKFNKLCKKSVLRYTDDWIQMSRRIGFWLDLDNSYVTMRDKYIESVWWSLKTLYDKGLVYKGTRVAPYCSRCGTTLSSHELAQGYKDVSDPAIFIKFKAADQENTYYLAWTTTPWTLISNVLLTVHPEVKYVKVEHKGEYLILAEALVEKVLGEKKKYLESYTGKELEHRKYEPIFPYLKNEVGDKGFFVSLADYVTTEDGSGIVHSAPAFGADDADTGNRYGVPVLNPVDAEGKFDDRITDFKGLWVKDADKKIIKMLDAEGKLFKRELYKHSYPHCWRCDTPLLYYGTESWFIAMSKLQTNMVDANSKVRWQPEYLKEGRFGNFIAGAVDWNLSRSRYWGTPLPVWICTDCKNIDFMGSKQDLVDRVGKLPKNFELHRPWVDKVEWACDCGGTFKRERYVIDTWYDSGSAAFAQYHYPFENKDLFENSFPYDFITEAIDQTRGWFYSLLAISTALFDKSSYTSVLCMNHVLAEDGSKMSKSKGNTIAPKELFDSVGADAIRWYLYSTPAWNPMRFGKTLVRDAQRRVLNTLWNVYSFFVTNANVDNYDPRDRTDPKTRSDIDQWIISRLQGVITEVTQGFEDMAYHVCIRSLDYFIVEELSNWYVRRSRRRFYGSELSDDKRQGYDTLFEVLTTLSKLMAPLTPYLTEAIYQNLVSDVLPNSQPSVHMEQFPTADDSLRRDDLERTMAIALSITLAGRTARAQAAIKTRQPISKMVIYLEDAQELPEELAEVVKEEMNVKELELTEHDEDYVEYKVQPMLKVLAPRVKGAVSGIKTYLENLPRDEAKRIIKSIDRNGSVKVTVDDKEWEFSSDEILVHTLAADGFEMSSAKGVEVFIATTLTPELKVEGLARGIIRHIQDTRRTLELDYLDRIAVTLNTSSRKIREATKAHVDYIKQETQADSIGFSAKIDGVEREIDGYKVSILVEKK